MHCRIIEWEWDFNQFSIFLLLGYTFDFRLKWKDKTKHTQKKVQKRLRNISFLLYSRSFFGVPANWNAAAAAATIAHTMKATPWNMYILNHSNKLNPIQNAFSNPFSRPKKYREYVQFFVYCSIECGQVLRFFSSFIYVLFCLNFLLAI